MSKRKSNGLMKSAKDTMKLGITTMAGKVAVGSLSSIAPGSGGSLSSVNAALDLANIGQLAKTAKKIARF